jgi:hypothetical protein
MTQNSGPGRQLLASFQPGPRVFPAPRVHADLAAAAAFAEAHRERAGARAQVRLVEHDRLIDAKPCAPENDDHAAQARSSRPVAGFAHHRDDLLDRRRISGIAHALVAGHPPLQRLL